MGYSKHRRGTGRRHLRDGRVGDGAPGGHQRRGPARPARRTQVRSCVRLCGAALGDGQYRERTRPRFPEERAVRHGPGSIPLPDVRDAYLAAVADSRPAKPRDCPPAWAKPRDCPLAWALAQGWGLSLGFAQRKDPSRCCRRLRVGISRPVLRVLELGRETRREGAPWRESCP